MGTEIPAPGHEYWCPWPNSLCAAEAPFAELGSFPLYFLELGFLSLTSRLTLYLQLFYFILILFSMHMYLWSTLGFTRDQMLCCCNWMSTIYIVGLINLVWGGGGGRALLLKKQTQNTLKIKGLVQCFCTDKEAQGNEGPIQGHAPTRNRGPFSTLLPRVSVPWLPPSFPSPSLPSFTNYIIY